ncbi:MAG: YkgJ family cysteine cluster protein [Desulfobacterales bacterium]
MTNDSVFSDSSGLEDFYREIHRQTTVFKLATGIRCLGGCGSCCENPKVEATVPEMYPVAVKIFREKKEEELMAAIQTKTLLGDKTCVFYVPDPKIPGNGRCAQYSCRALVCRLFGFAARRNKFGNKEFSPCRKIRERFPDLVENAQKAAAGGLEIPVYQDSFFRVASLFPDRGTRIMPINEAILQALEIIWWRKPLDFEYAKAS